MSPYVSPRQVAERRQSGRRAAAGILVEGCFALSLLGLGYLLSLLAAAL
ncbi:MAG TPA: hypothetical protein PLB91_03000 [Spirochaetales bacterium]|nr:hypothetical protein [Spirochaetales bacterium]HRY54687.1 hypothetical protein [Spirochaetia bacterium]HRZ63329.1 hypothetical protein [Spirochaetia bacterium]